MEQCPLISGRLNFMYFLKAPYGVAYSAHWNTVPLYLVHCVPVFLLYSFWKPAISLGVTLKIQLDNICVILIDWFREKEQG